MNNQTDWKHINDIERKSDQYLLRNVSAQIDLQNANSRCYVKRGGSNDHGFRLEPYLFTTTGRYFYSGTDWTIGMWICLY